MPNISVAPGYPLQWQMRDTGRQESDKECKAGIVLREGEYYHSKKREKNKHKLSKKNVSSIIECTLSLA